MKALVVILTIISLIVGNITAPLKTTTSVRAEPKAGPLRYVRPTEEPELEPTPIPPIPPTPVTPEPTPIACPIEIIYPEGAPQA